MSPPARTTGCAAPRGDHDGIGYVLARGRTGEEAARAAAGAAGRILRSLELEARAPAGAPAGPSPDGLSCGEHLLLLLGGEDPADRILPALGAVTARVSVVWTGGAGRAEARHNALWRRQYRGAVARPPHRVRTSAPPPAASTGPARYAPY